MYWIWIKNDISIRIRKRNPLWDSFLLFKFAEAIDLCCIFLYILYVYGVGEVLRPPLILPKEIHPQQCSDHTDADIEQLVDDFFR